MKKVLVLAALAALVTSSAFAGSNVISGTKHNLSSGSTNSLKSTNLDEICAFCHTPHAADTAAAAAFGAPLWNRSTTLDASFIGTAYTSGTLDTITQDYTNSDAVLCLSCHDGASMGGALVNNPNVLAGTAVAVSGQITGLANLGTDLTNDHPVGFNFADVVAADSGIQNPTNAKVKVTFGGGNDMWCSSCHDVHDNTNEPFLAIDNAGSALCLQCHAK